MKLLWVKIMPSEREQTVISSKGLMTIPEPYRAYFDIKEGEAIIVKWDRFILVRPKKVIPKIWEEILSDTLLSGHRPDAFSLKKLWDLLTEADKHEFLIMSGLEKIAATLV